MTDNDDSPAEVRRQDEEAELQIAAQAAGLRKDTEATHDDDLPEVRRQDEEAELQIAAQLAELRTDEDGLAARGRWSDLSKRTRVLLFTALLLRQLPTAPSGLRRSSTSRGGQQARSEAGSGCGRQSWHSCLR